MEGIERLGAVQLTDVNKKKDNGFGLRVEACFSWAEHSASAKHIIIAAGEKQMNASALAGKAGAFL